MASAKFNKLTDPERAAILRAVRDRIHRLADQLETAVEHVRRRFPGAQAEHDILTGELKLLENGVRKLWTGSNGHG